MLKHCSSIFGYFRNFPENPKWAIFWHFISPMYIPNLKPIPSKAPKIGHINGFDEKQKNLQNEKLCYEFSNFENCEWKSFRVENMFFRNVTQLSVIFQRQYI